MCVHVVFHRQAGGSLKLWPNRAGATLAVQTAVSHIRRALDQCILQRDRLGQRKNSITQTWDRPSTACWHRDRGSPAKDGADLPLVRTEGTVILPACKPALTAWRRGQIQPAYTAGLSQRAYRRCLGTLCSQRRKTDTDFSEWFIALKSEPCGNISKYPSSFPPKMQQNLLLFIFFINCFSPCGSHKNIWRKKRRRNWLFGG